MADGAILSGPMRTLLALHAHPDDESSKAAATVARYADEGVRCILVTATGGEAGDILNPAMDRPEVAARLPEIRRRELEEAAAIIGYDEVILLGHRDSGMPGTAENRHPDAFVNADFEQVLGEVVEIVRRERPQIVLGYDDHRWYPHPDHLRVYEVSMVLAAAAADPERFPEAGDPWQVDAVWAPLFSMRRILALHHAMVDRGLASPYAEWLARLDETMDDGRLISRIDVAATLERGFDALRAHATQVDPDGFWFQMPVDVIREVYPYEDFELLYARRPLPEPVDDLFAASAPG